MQRSDLGYWAVFPMRILVGNGFMEHGLVELSKGPDAFAGILQQMGVPLPRVAARRWLRSWSEVWLYCLELCWSGRSSLWL